MGGQVRVRCKKKIPIKQRYTRGLEHKSGCVLRTADRFTSGRKSERDRQPVHSAQLQCPLYIYSWASCSSYIAHFSGHSIFYLQHYSLSLSLTALKKNPLCLLSLFPETVSGCKGDIYTCCVCIYIYICSSVERSFGGFSAL